MSAREGADAILVDIADQIDTVEYTMARQEDLDETVRQVEALDRRAIAVVAEFGQIDDLIASAGIWTTAPFREQTEAQWTDLQDVDLSGV